MSPSASWPGATSTVVSAPPAASALRPSPKLAASPSWSMPSLSHRTLRAPVLAPCASAVSSAASEPLRSGAKGCGSSAPSVERASLGASSLSARAFAPLAVAATTTGRLCAWASAMTRSAMTMRSFHSEPAAHPLSRTRTTGPVPTSAWSREGLRTGSASARMTRAAASKRMRSSHHGVLAGVLSRFSRPTRMRVGGNSTCFGRGGTVRNSQ